jgi:hypothetical protein
LLLLLSCSLLICSEGLTLCWYSNLSLQRGLLCVEGVITSIVQPLQMTYPLLPSCFFFCCAAICLCARMA